MTNIPKGKYVILQVNGRDVMDDDNISQGVKLKIDKEVTLGLSSSWTELFEAKGSALLDVVGSGIRDYTGGRVGFSSQNKAFGFQYWTKSEPISFDMDFTFYAGSTGAYDAYTEVVYPMTKLSRLCLPSEGGTLGTLIAPGPSVLSLLDDTKIENTSGLRINIIIGGIYRFYNVIVKKAQPTWNKEVDDRGYPISGTINLEINTVFNATANMIMPPRYGQSFSSF